MKRLPLFLFALPLLLAALLLTACDPPWLPRPTESGRYIYGCKINGKRIRVNNWRDLNASIAQGGMLITAIFPDDQGRLDFQFLNGITEPKVIPITPGCVRMFDWTCIIYDNFVHRYKPVEDARNYFEITELNLDNGGYVSGLFDFVLVNDDDPTDTLFITEGRFDIGF
jgi:hypothetical protein